MGILGRLAAEVVENAAPEAPRALRAAGASRSALYLLALAPASLGRCLVFFFYRWETCLRESTVLGLLGLVTLGRLVQNARARLLYDEMLIFILLGAALVFLGDLVSSLVRRWVRH
jgi:phosphonate transport system permease protein